VADDESQVRTLIGVEETAECSRSDICGIPRQNPDINAWAHTRPVVAHHTSYDEASWPSSVLYHSTVFARPSSRLCAGAHPSIVRAFVESQYIRQISFGRCSSAPNFGSIGFPRSARILTTTSWIDTSSPPP